MLGTAILAKSMVIDELSESGQVGHVEPGKVYTYDGNLENAEGMTIVDEIIFAQIATGEFDLNKVARAELVYYGQSVALTSADMQVTTDADGTQKLIATVAGITLPGIVCKDDKLFVFSMGEHHVKTVEFAETIHPIKPKFIPGAVLPVVELSTAVGEALTEAENAKLNEVAATGLPCVICFTIEGMPMSAVFSFTDMSGLPMYSHTFGTMFIQLISDGTAWSANAETV